MIRQSIIKLIKSVRAPLEKQKLPTPAKFSLSYCDVSESLKRMRGFCSSDLNHDWWHKYSNLIYQIWKKNNKNALDARNLDGSYIKFKGE